MPIIAARPWFNSIARLRSCSSGEKVSHPRSKKSFRKSPANNTKISLKRLVDIADEGRCK